MSACLEWRTPEGYDPNRARIKWTVLATAIVPGTRSRFQVQAVRMYDEHREPTELYRLHDATTVSDADVRAGKFSKSIFNSYDLEEVLAHVTQIVIGAP